MAIEKDQLCLSKKTVLLLNILQTDFKLGKEFWRAF